MTFEQSIKILNDVLLEKQPPKFTASWIYYNVPKSYYYFWKYQKTDTGAIDWDNITSALDRSLQRKWVTRRHKQSKLYENQSEVEYILTKYKDKLYMFICVENKKDWPIQDKMVVRLVRLGQNGNVLAQQELIKWLAYLVDDWIDRYSQINKWKGYRDEVDDKIKGCIRCYRYTGSFIGYLFRTLEFAARGKPPQLSLDKKLGDGKSTLLDYIADESSYL